VFVCVCVYVKLQCQTSDNLTHLFIQYSRFSTLGLIMESPTFPLPAGRYLVTGGRAVTTGLTIDNNGNWKLDDGATLYDVTHLPCRAARYQPIPSSSDSSMGIMGPGSPAAARLSDFPVAPGATMPSITGTKKQDYAVLFIIGKATTAG
jgi:hypothetical protein